MPGFINLKLHASVNLSTVIFPKGALTHSRKAIFFEKHEISKINFQRFEEIPMNQWQNSVPMASSKTESPSTVRRCLRAVVK